jgi:hypothetical protein
MNSDESCATTHRRMRLRAQRPTDAACWGGGLALASRGRIVLARAGDILAGIERFACELLTHDTMACQELNACCFESITHFYGVRREADGFSQRTCPKLIGASAGS